MDYYLAPMEGITGYIYRRVYAECFHPLDKYFTPFLVPGIKRVFRTREIKDILPENNQCLTSVVPQLLTNRSEDFVQGARELSSYGYEEINLNLGCPSGTVVTKGKGAGFLMYPDQLDAFLDQVFEVLDMKISVKTRIGIDKPEEFERLLGVFNRYPLEELIIHPRLRKDHYKGEPNLEIFELAVHESKNPLCYNGNLFTAEDIKAFVKRFPSVERLMLGRGVLGNPALVNEIHGESVLDKSSFVQFHDRLVEEYRRVLGEKDTLFRMKELWFYMSHMFDSPEKYVKGIKKAGDLQAYDTVVRAFLREREIIEGAGFFFA